MSDSPQSQSEMGADAPRSSTLRTRPRPPLNRRRDKPQLSCNLCRRRKCTPCGTCSSRNLQCTYANAPRSDRGRHDDDASTSSPYNGIQNRIGLFWWMAYLTAESPNLPAVTPPLALTIRLLLFFSGTEALLQLPACHPGGNYSSTTAKENIRSPSFFLLQLFGYSCSREFLIMYKRLWNDPPSVPITWISILFSVFCIATRFQHAMEFHKDHSIKVKGKLSTETTSNYREKAVQALMLGQYTKGGPYVIEALLLYFTSEHFTNIDAQIESWLILSVTVNIAMRQGYHRDPRHFPQLSPYQGEMRRRVWATLYQVDLSISVQMGLPKLIRDNVSDTQLPGNYAENDFDPSTTQLPMPRPDTEMTPLLYTISKTRLVRVIGMIMEHVTEVQTPSYEDVIRIDAMLDEVYANMPEVFRWEGISESILSSTAIVSQKFFLGNKKNRENTNIPEKTALEAGLSILRLHHLVVEESKPSGQLYSFQFLFNSLVSHDLFAGALAVCFYLQHHRNSMDPGKLQETKSLLRKSQGLWIEASPTSVEAGKAAEALRIFLNRLDEETLAKQNTEDILSPSELFTSELMPCDVFQDSFWDIRLPFTYFPMDLPGPRPEEPVFLMLDGGQDVGTTESWLASV
ncbi:hypothetical protein PG989_009428 [Apiospora arundinis]